jgi:ubiquinone/menaquinone biosynthesis C-methylase UbiE
MSFYENHILPHIIGAACGVKPIRKQREKVVPAAEGVVLEVGMGAGPNLAFYDSARVSLVYGLEPSEGMRRKAAKAIAASPVPVETLDLPGETVPLEDASVDTVVLTYTLCTIPDWQRAMDEMRRVLKPGGRLLFSEHGLAPDEGVAKWQRRIEPVWKPIAGGCHLTRPIDRLIEAGGFAFDRVETMYLPRSPKFAGFTYWGSARPR